MTISIFQDTTTNTTAGEWPLPPTHPKTHPAKRAVRMYSDRIWAERDQAIDQMDGVNYDRLKAMTAMADEAEGIKYSIFNMVLNGQPDKATEKWAAFCQAHQLCLGCGGALVMELEGGGYGNDPSDVCEALRCRECGHASDWTQPAELSGEELPI